MAAKNTPTYDSSVMQEFARRLYRKANSVVLTSIFFGILAGLIASGFIAFELKAPTDMAGWIAGVTAFIFALAGYSIGMQKAFKYKLEAQHALCQVAIEENTKALRNLAQSR